MIRLLFALMLFTAALPPLAQAALPKARPFTGAGLLIIRPDPSGKASLPLYEEPGVRRLAEMEPERLPRLPFSVEDGLPVAVLESRGNWVKIAYDEAGREGWLEIGRRWSYTPWEAFLRGRSARALPGLKKEFYLMKRESSEQGANGPALTPKKSFCILQVEDDWVQGLLDFSYVGWMRWRDRDGRFLITVD